MKLLPGLIFSAGGGFLLHVDLTVQMVDSTAGDPGLENQIPRETLITVHLEILRNGVKFHNVGLKELLVDIYGGREDKLLMMEILRSQFDSFFF
jgi:hypothetical protein